MQHWGKYNFDSSLEQRSASKFIIFLFRLLTSKFFSFLFRGLLFFAYVYMCAYASGAYTHTYTHAVNLFSMLFFRCRNQFDVKIHLIHATLGLGVGLLRCVAGLRYIICQKMYPFLSCCLVFPYRRQNPFLLCYFRYDVVFSIPVFDIKAFYSFLSVSKSIQIHLITPLWTSKSVRAPPIPNFFLGSPAPSAETYAVQRQMQHWGKYNFDY